MRTKLWEAAVATQAPVAREGLARIMRMFQLERCWKDCSPDERKALRDRHLPDDRLRKDAPVGRDQRRRTLRSKLSWAWVSEKPSLSATSTNGLLAQLGEATGVTWMAPSESPAIAPAIPR